MIDDADVCLSEDIRVKLGSVSTATLASKVQQRGAWNCFLNGLIPLNPGERLVGVARTMRYVPTRPDLPGIFGSTIQRDTVEAAQPGEVIVIEARNEADAGTIGDIYAMQAFQNGAVGIVTDGALRDTPAIKAMGRPIYYRSSNAATLGRKHNAIQTQVPIACAGATVLPGDVIVGDDEGAIVIPRSMVEEVAHEAVEMEIEEEFIIERIRAGGTTSEYFPIRDDLRFEYDAWRAARATKGAAE